ncbi:hypothetical protein ACLMJK_004287 [Lecanora helva]
MGNKQSKPYDPCANGGDGTLLSNGCIHKRSPVPNPLNYLLKRGHDLGNPPSHSSSSFPGLPPMYTSFQTGADDACNKDTSAMTSTHLAFCILAMVFMAALVGVQVAKWRAARKKGRVVVGRVEDGEKFVDVEGDVEKGRGGDKMGWMK